MKGSYKKRLLIGLVLVGVVLLLNYLKIGHYITLEAIQSNRRWLQQLVAHNYWLFVAGFLGTFIVTATLSLPVTIPMSLAGGFFFGVFGGALYANIGATIGSTISFLFIRHLFGATLHHRYKDKLRAFNQEFKRYGYSYLLSIHFTMIIPLFIPNILAGLANISLWTFMWTTAVGLIPGTLFFAFAGQQLMTINAINDLLSLNFLYIILASLFIAQLPFLVRWFRALRRKYRSV